MSVLDLPPGIGLLGAPLGTFTAPRRSRRLAVFSLISTVALGLATWYVATRHGWHRHLSSQLTLPIAFMALAGMGLAVRSARVTITRDGVRWGWRSLSFLQSKARIATAHIYLDGVSLEAKRGSRWFLAARDWERFEGLVRQLRRAELPVAEYQGKAPLRARLQSYGRFLDGILIVAVALAVIVLVWAVPPH